MRSARHVDSFGIRSSPLAVRYSIRMQYMSRKVSILLRSRRSLTGSQTSIQSAPEYILVQYRTESRRLVSWNSFSQNLRCRLWSERSNVVDADGDEG